MLSRSTQNSKCSKILNSEYRDHFMRLGDPGDEFFTADLNITNRINDILNEDIACAFEELNVALTSGELNEAIKQLKSGKSSGEDLLLNEFFISWAPGADALCTSFVQLCFKLWYFPWCLEWWIIGAAAQESESECTRQLSWNHTTESFRETVHTGTK